MRVPPGFYVDNPAWPLVQTVISYWGITSANGNALGTTLVDANLANEPGYAGLAIKPIDGDAAGQVRPIAIHDLVTGTITVAAPFTDNAGAVVQILAGTRFVIISIAGGGGAPPPAPPAPSVGLWMFGVCDPGMAASLNTLVMANLAGFNDDIFNNEFWVQVIHNDDAPGTAPEREIRRVLDYVGATGTFTTDPFSVNVEASDLVCVFHESIMGIEILGFGTLDTSSTTVPADSTRAAAYAWENNGYFEGCMLMPTEGNCRFQPRPIGTYTAATGVFGLAHPFSQAPGLVDYVIIAGAYPYSQLKAIFDLLNAMLVTTETGGTITTDGTEQDVYINNAPAGVYEPLKVMLDFFLQAAAETVVIRTYYRIKSGGTFRKKDEVTFAGVQAIPLKNIELEPNRFGVWVSIQRTAGGAQDYDWEVIYRA